MDYVSEIKIMEAIVHVLDRNSDEPILNEFPLELNDDLYKFVLKHVERALKDEELKLARFNSDDGVVKKVVDGFLEGQHSLIEVSQELARLLFAIMKSNEEIQSCDLMVVSLSTEFGPMVALFKMDYVKNYIHKIEFVDNKMSIKIIPQTTGLPVSSQKIQKCAFIKAWTENMDYDLLVIDKQGKKSSEEESASKFFINDFLNCTIIDSSRDLTKRFLNATETWTRANTVNDAAKAEEIRSTIKKTLMEEDNIDIKELSNNIFQNESEKQAFVDFVAAQGIEEKLPVDKQWVEKKLKRVRLKIDKEIDLYIDSSVYHDNSKFEIIRNGDGSINMIIKHIKNYIEK
ncbi:MAG: nucleoid-associated protein [Clostridiales bacterium]|uniref:nucleoid-associated protein n=1 Tax=Clostridium sp. N3C TaxID=1776758 RepID=UPI00092E1576|nr:nucleoid-associated protein [Clostridium sp. N3C]NLZ47865.1 nucleoid-associated protein [Clostridiales bacterium]SCN24336.1 37-kD nucleoid-associated bacterial protein [Clostridium sp. N3C]